MAHSSSSISSMDMYLSKIVSGAHGDKYQKDLALVIFERATRLEYGGFRLGYEMEIADKFDDVALYCANKNEWTLIQTKHSDTSKGKPSPLKFEQLFPLDEETREKGDFSLFKYLKSYVNVQVKIPEPKTFIIFTNRGFLETTHMQLVEVVPREVDEILCFDGASHKRLEVKQPFIDEMLNYVNRDFNLLRDSIIKLFKEETLTQTIMDYKTPVVKLLTKTSTMVKFSEQYSSEASQILTSLCGVIDILTAQVPIAKCKNLFTGKSRNKTLPLATNADTVQQFFQDLVLSVRQPDDLRGVLHQDLRLWLRTWIRPDYFVHLEDLILEKSVASLVSYFEKKQSAVEVANDKNSYKNYMQLSDGEEFFESVKQTLVEQIFIPLKLSVNNINEYYISRQIEYLHSDGDSEIKMRTRDDEFFNELSTGRLKDQRFLLLIAEPGMGKSTSLEFIALGAQRKSSDCVYLFGPNSFQEKLTQFEKIDTYDKVLCVLETVLSESNGVKLRKTLERQDADRKYLIVFDGLDEVSPENRNKVLEMFCLLLEIPKVTIFVSARKTIKTLLEDKFKVKAMSLVPFNRKDQTNFLRQFWKVSHENDGRFCKYVAHLFKIFHSDVNRALREFTGIPLMMRMLAEVYSDHFKEYLASKQNNLDDLIPLKTFSTLNLYEQFVAKCFAIKINKKFNFNLDVHDEYNSLLFEKFTLEHQLLAIKHLDVEFRQNVFKDEHYGKMLQEFEERITSGTEGSPLVEADDKGNRFIHLSYAEFLVAKFLVSHIDSYEVDMFLEKSIWGKYFFDEYAMIKLFVFAMIEVQNNTQHLEILKRNYLKIKKVVIWACECTSQKIVEFLLRIKSNAEIIYELLGVAAEHNYYKLYKYLLENRQVFAGIGFEYTGSTHLHTAAANGHKEIIEVMIDHGGDINVKDYKNGTLLHSAALNGRSEVVKFLIDHGGDINAKNEYGRTPLHAAAVAGHCEVVQTLINHCGIKDEHDSKPIKHSFLSNVSERTIHLKDVNLDCSTPLHFAAQYNYTEIVKVLIERFGVKDHYDTTPLCLAARSGALESVKILLDHSSDVNAKNQYGWTPLHHAALRGNLNVLNILIEHGGNVNERTNQNWTPVHIALHEGHIEIAKTLITHGANINAKTDRKWTPLHFACRFGYLEIVELLIDRSENINARTDPKKILYDSWWLQKILPPTIPIRRLLLNEKRGWTPLELACISNHPNIVQILVDHSANVNTKANDGWTPFHLASLAGNTETVKLLVKKSTTDIDSDVVDVVEQVTPMHYASQHGFTEIVKILIDHGRNVNVKDIFEATPLHRASENNRREVAKLLIDHGANIQVKNKRGETPLHRACAYGRSEIVKRLIDHGAKIEAKNNGGETPLYCACNQSCFETVKLLIDHGANIDAKNNNSDTPLHRACEYGRSEIVKLLIDHGAKIEAKNNDGETPLYCACECGHSRIVKLLIDHGANIQAKNKDGETPLYRACWYGRSEIVKLLIDHGANIQAKNKDGETPLYRACWYGRSEIVKLLIDHGAKTEAKNNDGETPLHRTCEYGNWEIVKLLIDLGAKIEAKNNNSDTPLHRASKHGFSDIVKLLIDHGANIDAKNKNGGTPLHRACKHNRSEIVKLLTDHGANIDAKNNNSETPLNHACKYKRSEIVQFLIDLGAKLEAKNNDGLHSMESIETAQKNEIQRLEQSNKACSIC